MFGRVPRFWREGSHRFEVKHLHAKEGGERPALALSNAMRVQGLSATGSRATPAHNLGFRFMAQVVNLQFIMGLLGPDRAIGANCCMRSVVGS